MPIIPTYQRRQIPGVRSVPPYSSLVGAQNQMAAQLTNIGQSLSRTSEVTISLIAKKQAEKDAADVQDTLNQAYAADREYALPQYAKTGKDAIHVYDDAKQYFSDRQQYWLSQLDTEEKQRAFKQRYSPRADAHLNRLFAHQLDQTKVYRDATRQGAIVQNIEDAVVMRNNFEYVQAMRLENERSIREQHADMEGAALDVLVKENTGKMYLAVMNGLIADENVEVAQDFYDKYIAYDPTQNQKEKIPEAIREQLLSKLKAAKLVRQAQVRTDLIIGRTADYNERLELGKKSDPAIRDSVMSRLRAAEQDEKRHQAEADRQYLDTNVDRIILAGSYEKALDIIEQVPAGRGGIRLKLLDVADGVYKKTKKPDNDTLLWDIMKATDEGLINDPRQIIDLKKKLPDKQWDEAVKYITGGGAAGKVKETDIEKAYSLIIGKKAADDFDNYKFVRDQVLTEIKMGLAPTFTNVLDAVKRGVEFGKTAGERRGGFGLGYGRDMTYYEAVKNGYEADWLPDITAEERRYIGEEIAKLNEEQRKKSETAGEPFMPMEINDLTIRRYKRKYIMGLP